MSPKRKIKYHHNVVVDGKPAILEVGAAMHAQIMKSLVEATDRVFEENMTNIAWAFPKHRSIDDEWRASRTDT